MNALAQLVSPEDHAQAQADTVFRVLDRIQAGESERSACEAEGIHRTTFRTVALRCKADAQYARALESLAESQITQVEQTIQDMRDGIVDAQKARVEIEARKWFASKFLPKRYGDRLQVAGDQDQPLRVINAFDPNDLTPDERAMLRQLAQALVERQKQRAIEDQSET